MQRYVEGTNRNQYNMMLMNLESMIDEENPVRAIDIIVDSLDLEKLGFKYAKTKKTGRKPYNPSDMLKLYIYGYFNKIRASRKLEAECLRNIELMWLINSLKPDFKTIANFRKDNKQSLENVFKEFSMLCDELGLYGKKIIAIDGSKFRADNSRRKNYTKRKVKKMIEYYEQAAKKYIALLDEGDKEDDKEKESETIDIKEKIENAKKRIEELNELAKQIQETGEKSITDPDARHMSVSNNGTDIAHNVQIAVDSKHHLVVAVDVVSTPADQGQLYKMAKMAAEELGIKLKEEDNNNEDIMTVLADKGYYSGSELEKCKELGITAIVPKQKSTSKTANQDYAKDKFDYDKEKDIYICPQLKILRNVSRKDSKEQIYKNKKACIECRYKEECTSHEKGRSIRRGQYQEIYDEVDKRTTKNKELYSQRQMLVEHPFGTIKRGLGFTYFLTRGNESVKAESFMYFFIYNLKRVINIIGAKGIIERLKASFLPLLRDFLFQ
jgi:transposase